MNTLNMASLQTHGLAELEAECSAQIQGGGMVDDAILTAQIVVTNIVVAIIDIANYVVGK